MKKIFRDIINLKKESKLNRKINKFIKGELDIDNLSRDEKEMLSDGFNTLLNSQAWSVLCDIIDVQVKIMDSEILEDDASFEKIQANKNTKAYLLGIKNHPQAMFVNLIDNIDYIEEDNAENIDNY